MSGAVIAAAAAAASDPLRATAAPSYASGTTVAGPFTVTAKGGVPPYSYAWEQVDGDAMTVLSPTSVATSIQAAHAAYANFRCKVTDATASFVYTNSVTAETTGSGGGGGGGA